MAPENKEQALEQQVIQRHIDETAENESQDYIPFFAGLGLSNAKGLELIEDMKRLHQGSARVNNDIIKLDEARYAYDKKIRSMLTPEAYEKYREFEAAKPARTELDVMSSYLTSQNQTLSPTASQSVLAALQKYPAITSQTWHGPYDPVPRPLAGKEVIPYMEDFIRNVDNSLPGLLNEISQSLTEQELNSVSGYYSNRLSFFARVIKSAQQPLPPPEMEAQQDLERIRKNIVQSRQGGR